MEHPDLPYVLAPNYVSPTHQHNSLGFKGKDITVAKDPSKKRIVVIGASTTYGMYVQSQETYAGRLEALLNESGDNVEVINAGVPGYVSTEVLLNLQLRVLPLQPDLIILYEGRNDLMPQSFNNFTTDYSHYRRKVRFDSSNYYLKKVFSVSRLAMLLCTYKGDRCGWSTRLEDPAYAGIRYENVPNDAQLIRNLEDPQRSSVYRRSIEQIVLLSRESNANVLLATMAVRAEMFSTGVLNVPRRNSPGNDHDPAIYDALQKQVDENNQILREVALAHGVPVAETHILSEHPELFVDDCHMRQAGHSLRAKILFDAIRKHGLLEEKGRTRVARRMRIRTRNSMVRRPSGDYPRCLEPV